MTFQQYPSKGGIPGGNTAGRPSGAAIGDTYYNGQLGLLEIYDGTNWVPCSSPAAIPTVSAVDVGTSRAYTSGAITYTFTAGTNGGAPYGYTALAQLSGSSYSSTTTSATVTVSVGGPGTYTYSGTAYNGFGTSPSSPSSNVVVTTVPDVPTSVTGSSATTNSIVVSWTAGPNGGKTITQYTVTPYIGTTAQTSTTTTGTSVTVTGLTGGTTYTFKVKATNANGDGLDSTASASITTAFNAEVLVVAGGGAGGLVIGGGGGAGGYRTSSSYSLAPGNTLTITVGAGQSGTSGSTGRGGDSTFGTITATGGGGNTQTADTNGVAGGSGGGAPWRDTGTLRYGGAGNLGSYSPVEGYAGGDNAISGSPGDATNCAAGGGGSSAVGQNAGARGTGQGGNGGNGTANSITGSSVTYAGGGAGSGRSSSGNGSGGTGGGGGSSTSGTANTGGGGGGNNYGGGSPGAGSGGSGVVIVAYPSSNSAITTIPGTLTYTSSTSSRTGYRVYTFTAGTGTVTI